MCKYSDYQEYKCATRISLIKLGDGSFRTVCIDRCIEAEVLDLNKIGIVTVGSCCGHGRDRGYIQVDDQSVKQMKLLGYMMIPEDIFGNGKNCFVPRTYFRDRYKTRPMMTKDEFEIIKQMFLEKSEQE